MRNAIGSITVLVGLLLVAVATALGGAATTRSATTIAGFDRLAVVVVAQLYANAGSVLAETATSLAASATSRPTAYYRNCADVRAAGAAPLRRGAPGYRAELDGNDDGVACE